ncbi:restriction endonuclease subunit S [Vibrio fluvialis]|uniref:restriction endonuclease subunit S n=1 Tax=Vibrio fluvialis TaxID=676 RepID=UPI00301C1535
MGSDLTSMRLADCMEAIIDYRGKTPTKTSSGIPLITAKIIKNGRIQEVNEFIAENDYDNWMRRGIPKEGDVVLTTEAPLGEVAQLDGRKIALAQRVITLRGKKDVLDNDYLLYLLQSHDVQHQLDGRGTGSTVKGIKQSELKEIILTFPSIYAQKKIAQHLKNIDNKITLNRQINQTLEQMAQTLFKSWFVDFDPVIDNALDAGNAIPDELQARAEQRQALRHAENEANKANAANQPHSTRTNPAAGDALASPYKPLPDDLRQLFPNEFEESELGWVPKGWRITRLENILELAYGKALKKTDRIDGSYPVYGSGGINGTHNEYLVKGPGIIVGRKGTVGSLYWERCDFFPIDTVFYVKPKRGYSLSYCFYLLQTLGLETMNTDAAVPGLNRNNAYRLQCVIPSQEIRDFLSKVLGDSRNKMNACSQQIETLTNLRDSLLPKLISGELKIEGKL